MSNTPPPKRAPTSPIGLAVRPQRNVPEVIVEESTPVEAPLPVRLDGRTKRTQEGVTALAADIGLLRAELTAYVAADNLEHQELRSQLKQITERFDDRYGALERRYESLDSKVDGVITETATANGKLDILVESVRSQQQVFVHQQKVSIDIDATERKVKLEDEADEKKFKRQKWLKIFGILTTLAGAIAGSISIASC